MSYSHRALDTISLAIYGANLLTDDKEIKARLNTIRENLEIIEDFIGKLKRDNYGLTVTATTDHLTGLYNRRFFDEQIRKELSRLSRKSSPFSLLLIDLDRLKDLNDKFGHTEGDGALVMLASVLASSLREGDEVARIGGDEFAVLLPSTTLNVAFEIAKRVQQEVEKTNCTTVSIGISSYEDFDNVQTLMKRADEALYRAKNSGRNKCST